MDSFFSVKSVGTPSKKQHRVDTNEESAQPPVTKLQAEWMRDAVGSAMTALGGHIEQRFQQYDEELKTVKRRLETLEARASSSVDVDRVAQLEKEIQEIKQKQSTDVAPSTAPLGSSVPYEQRVVARIGNLGWDDVGDTVTKRAKEVLHEAGVQSGEWKSLAPVNAKKGSAVELIFTNPASLQASRIAVRALNKKYVPDKYVWLDAKKERSETKPARVMYRMKECLADIEAGREDKAMIKEDMRAKCISVNGTRIGYTLHGQWRWTHAASQRYTLEVMDFAKAYAEDE